LIKFPSKSKPKRKAKSPSPSREEILHFIQDSPKRVGKREIARAFNLDARQKMDLKKALREMELDGTLKRDRGRRVADPGSLPPVMVIEVTGTDTDGELMARPLAWEGKGEPPVIYISRDKRPGRAARPGDRLLARLTDHRHLRDRRWRRAAAPHRPPLERRLRHRRARFHGRPVR